MAMMDHKPVTRMEDWYKERQVDDDGALTHVSFADCVPKLKWSYEHYKREMEKRVTGKEDLEKIANNEVTVVRPDRPNISSGEVAGIVLRIARIVVQNAPNVEVISSIEDDSLGGVVADYILRSKILHYDTYTNDLRTRLQATVKAGLTISFDCVVPVLDRKPNGEWWIQYDSIHYRDVFPEPGAVDIREATSVFVRRYLTKGDVAALIESNPAGWNVEALRAMLKPHWQTAPLRQHESNSRSDIRRGALAEGFEVVTLYTNTGAPFLTFEPRTMNLLRIEHNLHPNKEHPVFFFIPEWDHQNPLGKSLVERLRGRQDFQDMFFNGAAKAWELSIDPPILAYGAPRAVLNLGPGKANRIDNPNAKIEPFDIGTSALQQYSQISQGNLGSMVNISGSADQQMATQAGAGMSATPQGVAAQQTLVDITTNDYQKSVEMFVNQYASYALTIWFQEMKGVKKIKPSADARRRLVNAAWITVPGEVGPDGQPGEEQRINQVLEVITESGEIEIDFSSLAVEYFVRCIPGSMTEMEDEKQVRILKEMFVPLSQAMPAIAQTQNPELIGNAAATMQFIIEKTLELSGSAFSEDLKTILKSGSGSVSQSEDKLAAIEQELGGATQGVIEAVTQSNAVVAAMQEQIKGLVEAQEFLMQRLGVSNGGSTDTGLDMADLQLQLPPSTGGGSYAAAVPNQGAAQ